MGEKRKTTENVKTFKIACLCSPVYYLYKIEHLPLQLQILLKMLFRVVYTCNWGEVLNGSETENEVEILSPITKTAEPDLPMERGRWGGGGGVGRLPIARDWKWGGWRGSCLSIKESLFFRKTCGFTVPVNWHIVITSTIYSLEIPIPCDCGLRACCEFMAHEISL